jgi:hypothetical protein
MYRFRTRRFKDFRLFGLAVLPEYQTLGHSRCGSGCRSEKSTLTALPVRV